jgi:hypothetical protein
MTSACLISWYSPSASSIPLHLILVLSVSRRSITMATLLDTSISKWLQLFRYGNAPHYQNGCKPRTITMGGRNEADLKQKNKCYRMLSFEKLTAIQLVWGGEKPTRRVFPSETSQGNLRQVPPSGIMMMSGWRTDSNGRRSTQDWVVRRMRRVFPVMDYE